MKKIICLFLILANVQSVCAFTYFRSVETLDVIKKIIEQQQKGALMRFGDGDIALAQGSRSGTHAFSEALQQEMIEAFGMNGAGILKTLPIACHEHGGPEVDMFYHDIAIRETSCITLVNDAQKFWGEVIDHIYSPIALPYTFVYKTPVCHDFFRFLKRQPMALFVGNENIPLRLIRLLFGNCPVVKTPARTAYEKIDTIERECRAVLDKHNNYGVVIVSCGNTGRVLIKRLYPECGNLFFLDMGSIMDAFCGWQTRNWIRKGNFDVQSFLTSLAARIMHF